jgi:hypothetical protein
MAYRQLQSTPTLPQLYLPAVLLTSVQPRLLLHHVLNSPMALVLSGELTMIVVEQQARGQDRVGDTGENLLM